MLLTTVWKVTEKKVEITILLGKGRSFWKAKLSAISFRVIDIIWVVPPPRMPVTTRIIPFLIGNLNLNLHFHYYWEGGCPPRYHHGIMKITSWMILALKFREVSFAALNHQERFADTRTEREWKDGTEVRNKKKWKATTGVGCFQSILKKLIMLSKFFFELFSHLFRGWFCTKYLLNRKKTELSFFQRLLIISQICSVVGMHHHIPVNFVDRI